MAASFSAAACATATATVVLLLGGVATGLRDKSWNKLLWSTGVRWNPLAVICRLRERGLELRRPDTQSGRRDAPVGDLGFPGRNGQLPNPDLRPESGIGGDLGLELSAWQPPGGRPGVPEPHRRRIVDNVVSQNPSQTRSVNAGDATSYGVEVALDQALGHRVSWFVNATYSHSRIGNPIDPNQDGAEIPFVPEWMANVGASYRPAPRVHRVALPPRGGHLLRQHVPERPTVVRRLPVPALRLQAVLAAGARSDVVFALDLNNLVDDRYAMPWQFRDPGFNVFATVAVRLR